MKRCLLYSFLLACTVVIQEAGAAPPNFKKDIAPVFKAKCTKCHGLIVKQKGLSLRNLKSTLKGGESGAVVVPGKPEKSILLQQFSLPETNPKRMPPITEKAQLTAGEKKLFEDWIQGGAK
ncbi:MAG: hypothetical protein ACI9R3_003190 [Verrucomicrobiales bacterium]|jgi:hypothetical protein